MVLPWNSASRHARSGELTRRVTRTEGTVKDETFSVTTSALVCAQCHHIAFEGKDVQEHMRRVADAYRSKHGLLTSEEIRAARIKRWELRRSRTSRTTNTSD